MITQKYWRIYRNVCKFYNIRKALSIRNNYNYTFLARFFRATQLRHRYDEKHEVTWINLRILEVEKCDIGYIVYYFLSETDAHQHPYAPHRQ